MSLVDIQIGPPLPQKIVKILNNHKIYTLAELIQTSYYIKDYGDLHYYMTLQGIGKKECCAVDIYIRSVASIEEIRQYARKPT